MVCADEEMEKRKCVPGHKFLNLGAMFVLRQFDFFDFVEDSRTLCGLLQFAELNFGEESEPRLSKLLPQVIATPFSGELAPLR